MLTRFSPGALSVVAGLGLLGVLVGSFACADLKRADETADAGDDAGGTTPTPGEDASTPTVDGGATPDAEVDAGPPPPDFECTNDAWTKPTKTKAECAPRQVKDLENDIAINAGMISIARTPAGRVGIVYKNDRGTEAYEMRLFHFKPDTSTYAIDKITRGDDIVGDYRGASTRIGASSPDVLHVLSHDVESSDSGPIVVTRLTNGTPPLSNPDLVVAGVPRSTELGMAVDTAGNTLVTARIKTGATTAKLSGFKAVAGAAFNPILTDLTTALLPAQAPGTGASSVFVDPSGQFHLLYHYCEVQMHSAPRYHTLDGASWSYRKTVDNAVLDGFSGYSPRVATHGTKKFAAYFFRKAGQSTPATADLRLATWQLSTDTPQIEIVDQNIPSVDAMAPMYKVAMAVDKFGLVHLAIVRPTSATAGYLEYRRQTRETGGTIKWLSDIIDGDVLADGSEAWVDLVVDVNARPHIAYLSGKDLKARYATRYDR